MKSEIIQHISQDLLLRYVEDDCSRTEMRGIDRHLATCPMCSDAVEGLMLLSAPSVVVDNLNKRIDEKIATWSVEKFAEMPVKMPLEMPVLTPVLTVVKSPFWQQRWAAVAAILLLLSGSFWVFNNSQKVKNQAVTSTESAILPNSDTTTNPNIPPQYAAAETAKNDAKTASPIILKTEDKIASTTATSSGITRAETADANVSFKDNLGKNQAEGVNEKAASSAPKPSADIAVADNVSIKPSANAPTYSSAPEYDRTRDYTGATIQNTVQRPETSVPAKPQSASVTKLEEKEDNVKYSKSKESAKEVVVTNATKAKKQETPTPSVSSTSDQILSRADLYFKQKHYDTAAADYAQFINLEPSGDRYERAFFQLATCYVNMNRKADAKVIFQKLVGMNGQYERAAKKALKDL